ncbi:MAG: hypothetical protein HC887_09830 [Desulfobacteraceae bacterium]|nr:hypothetical protein [Desulfobacteraceae bacterium]
MKLKDDPWLTDYVNAIHFSVRVLEKQGRYRQAIAMLKLQTAALIREAILANVPMEVFSMQRISNRVKNAESENFRLSYYSQQPLSLNSYSGDVPGLMSDYKFIRDGFAEFGLKDLIDECRLYLEKIYTDISDLEAAVTELFEQDIHQGVIREIKPGLYAQTI